MSGLSKLVDDQFNVFIHSISPKTGIPDSATDILDYGYTDSGTHKIIKATRMLQRAPESQLYLAITSGNYGKALAHAATQQNKRVALVVAPDVYESENLEQLASEHVELFRLDVFRELGLAANGKPPHLNFPQAMGYDALLGEKLVQAYFSMCGRRNRSMPHKPASSATNITNVNDIWNTVAYSEPIYSAPRHLADYEVAVVPTGSAELLFDLARQTPTTHFYGVIPQGHPFQTGETFAEEVQESIANKLTTPTVPLSGCIRNQSNVTILDATEEELQAAYQIAQTHNRMRSEPSGSAAFVYQLPEFRQRHGLETSKHAILVNTGKSF